jgi:hypothetical protein
MFDGDVAVIPEDNWFRAGSDPDPTMTLGGKELSVMSRTSNAFEFRWFSASAIVPNCLATSVLFTGNHSGGELSHGRDLRPDEHPHQPADEQGPRSLSFADWGKSRVMNELENVLSSLEGGINTGSIDAQLNPSYAYGVLLGSGGSGAVGGTIGGKLVTAAFASSDAATADLIAAAINADTTANTYVSATSRTATGT